MLLLWMEATESVCWILSSCLVDNASFLYIFIVNMGLITELLFSLPKKRKKKKRNTNYALSCSSLEDCNWHWQQQTKKNTNKLKKMFLEYTCTDLNSDGLQADL